MSDSPHGPIRGMTLVETMVATTAMMLVGSLMFYTLNAGMVLFAKNTAVNVAHQQARVAVLTMEQDLHSAVSIPKLIDINQAAVTGNIAAAGISFQLFAAGPFRVTTTAPSAQTQIHLDTTTTIYPAPSYAAVVTTYLPKVGQRLCLPLHQTELDITAVSGPATDRVVTLASALPYPVESSLLDASNIRKDVIATAFITDRYSYVVNTGQLRYFKPGDTVGKLLANNITTSTPFSIPVTPAGAAYNRFVAAINLSTAESSSTNRNFKSANMFLNAMVPYRAKLCLYQ